MPENPETALWRAVLATGLADERKTPGWLASRDFDAVCHLAGLDPEGVARAAAEKRKPHQGRKR